METFHNQTITVPVPRDLLVLIKWTPMCLSFPYELLLSRNASLCLSCCHCPAVLCAVLPSAYNQASWQTVAPVGLFPAAQVAVGASSSIWATPGCKSEMFSFLYVGLKDQIDVIRLGGWNLHLLSHHASPSDILHLPPFSTSKNSIN